MNVFIDSNILIYAQDQDAGRKHDRAKQLITEIWLGRKLPSISIQVLQEVHVNLVRKGISVEESARRVSHYFGFQVVDNNKLVFSQALEVQKKFQLSFWDSSIISAAQISGSKELWTEDLNDGQNYGGVIARNPLV